MDPFDPPSTPTGPMGCASGDRLSPLRRFGAIYGVLNASRELSFDICHQSLHQTTFSSSLMSSRDWLSRGGSPRRRGRARSPCVAMSSPPGDLRRSERVSWAVFRCLPSAVTSDDVSLISGELAQLALAWGGPGGEGRAPGRRASPFHRLRAIYGVLNASSGLSFDICHQPLHKMTLRYLR